MKNSTKLLLATAFFLLATSVGHAFWIKWKFDKGEYAHADKLHMPKLTSFDFDAFTSVRIEGAHEANIEISESPTYSVKATPNKFLQISQNGDTLLVQVSHDEDVSEDQRITVRIAAPTISNITTGGYKIVKTKTTVHYSVCSVFLKGFSESNLTLNVGNGTSVDFKDNRFDRLNCTIDPLSSVKFSYNTSIDTLNVLVKPSASLDLGNAGINHIIGKIDQNAKLTLRSGNFNIEKMGIGKKEKPISR